MDDGNSTAGTGRRLSPLFTWRGAIADTELRSTAKLVAFALSLFMSEAGESCFPSIQTLAEKTSLSPSTVSTGLKTLIDEGWLKRTQGGGGRGRSTRYTAIFGETAREQGGLETARLSAKLPGSAPETTRLPGTNTSKNTSKDHANPRNARPKNPIWDVLVELYGEPLTTPRGKIARGGIVKDIRERLKQDGVRNAAAAVEEVRRRYVALASEWGSRATARALVEHWHVAGQMAGKPQVSSLSATEIAQRAIELRRQEEAA